MSINSAHFKGHLHRIFEQEQGKLPTSTAVSAILPSLLDIARQGGIERIWRRVAMPNDSSVVIDLYQHDHPGRCVVINPNGWEVRESWPTGVIFDTSSTMAALPTPLKGGGSLERIRQALGMASHEREGDWQLLVAFLVATLLPMMVHPILVCEGKPNSGKSFAAGRLRRLIDPHGIDDDDDGSSIPFRRRELAAKIRNEFFALYDNVSQIPRCISDDLCLTIKGSCKIQTPRFYKTAELATFYGPVFVGMSMIGTSTTPPDLLSRVLRIQFERPRDGWGLPPDQATALVTQSSPGAQADLYDLCALVMSKLPESRPTKHHRLYDFLRILTALDEIKGWKTVEAFLEASSAVQGESVVDLQFTFVLQRFLAGYEENTFEGTFESF